MKLFNEVGDMFAVGLIRGEECPAKGVGDGRCRAALRERRPPLYQLDRQHS
jgi:hypothetical protein